MDDNERPTLASVMGANLRAHREQRGWSRDDVARKMAEAGFGSWTVEIVGDIERGGRPVTVAELAVMPFALDLPARRLLAGDGPVQVTAGLVVTDLDEVRAPFARRPPAPQPVRYLTTIETARRSRRIAARASEAEAEAAQWWPEASPYDILRAERAATGEAEVKAGRRLGVSPFVVSLVAHRLWTRSLTEERDERATATAPGDQRSRQAIRGHVTRQLLAELAQIIEQEG